MAKDLSKLPYRRCVGVMVMNGAGKVWLGRRVGSPNQDGDGRIGGWWQMPQGGIDAGEDPAAAAVRELAEETGMRTAHILAESADWYPYDLPPELIGRAWGGRYRGQTQKWFLLCFTGEDSEVDIAPAAHQQEFDSWRWAELGEVLGLIVPFKRDVYEKVLAEFGDIVRREAQRS
jgi:putative (di)nucleoside polyphosphate hydrolase